MTLRIPVYADPREVTWTPDDVVVLAVKSQDTEAAARDLVAAAGRASPWSPPRTAWPTSAPWPAGSRTCTGCA